MQITLARIDDRLIHGGHHRVVKVANAQRIIICNDDVFNDEVRRTLLRRRLRRHEGKRCQSGKSGCGLS